MKVGDLVKIDGYSSGYGSGNDEVGMVIEDGKIFGDSRIALIQLHDRDEWFDTHHCKVINEA